MVLPFPSHGIRPARCRTAIHDAVQLHGVDRSFRKEQPNALQARYRRTSASSNPPGLAPPARSRLSVLQKGQQGAASKDIKMHAEQCQDKLRHFSSSIGQGKLPKMSDKIKTGGAPKERRRRRAEKWLSKRVFLESPFLLCLFKVCS